MNNNNNNNLEEQNHGLSKCLEVVHIIKATFVPDVHEEGHAKYGKDEHDEKEQEADIEECRQRHGQSKQQSSNTLGALDQTQDSTHLGHSHHSKQCWGHKVLLNDVTQHKSCTHESHIHNTAHIHGIRHYLFRKSGL